MESFFSIRKETSNQKQHIDSIKTITTRTLFKELGISINEQIMPPHKH